MKKTKIALLALFIGIIFLLVGCASTKIGTWLSFGEDKIIAPDLANPLQGTWVSSFMGTDYVHIINGMSGEQFLNRRDGEGWLKAAAYTIETDNNNGWITNNNVRISVSGDILTVGGMRYKRYTGI